MEEAVLAEFDRIADPGGVLGAMETGYQRGRIQDESMLYEHRKHDGSLPIIGVNTFRAPESGVEPPTVELARDRGREGSRSWTGCTPSRRRTAPRHDGGPARGAGGDGRAEHQRLQEPRAAPRRVRTLVSVLQDLRRDAGDVA